jgi:hypothetical protein
MCMVNIKSILYKLTSGHCVNNCIHFHCTIFILVLDGKQMNLVVGHTQLLELVLVS